MARKDRARAILEREVAALRAKQGAIRDAAVQKIAIIDKQIDAYESVLRAFDAGDKSVADAVRAVRAEPVETKAGA